MPRIEPMVEAWYALRSKPNKEDVLYRLCLSRDFTIYFPRLRVKPVDPRSRVIKPMFPGYMFIHEDVQKRGISAFQWLPYSNGLVTFGGVPGEVPSPFISSLQERVRRLNQEAHDPLRGWHRGDEVVVRSGPFAGYEGIYDSRLSGKDRVRILLNLLNDHWTKVEIEHSSLEKRKRD
jgi:transcription antitermination factor NusG